MGLTQGSFCLKCICFYCYRWPTTYTSICLLQGYWLNKSKSVSLFHFNFLHSDPSSFFFFFWFLCFIFLVLFYFYFLERWGRESLETLFRSLLVEAMVAVQWEGLSSTSLTTCCIRIRSWIVRTQGQDWF